MVPVLEEQEFYRRLNYHLKRIRQEKGMTQTEVAAATGIPQYSISDWETGRKAPMVPSILRLAQFYGVSLSDLVEKIPEDGPSVAP